MFVEDLSITNMAKSERGSQENRGTNVKQTLGLKQLYVGRMNQHDFVRRFSAHLFLQLSVSVDI